MLTKGMTMLKTFIEAFDLPKDSDFKMIELENAIMKKFGDIQYGYHKAYTYTSDYDYQEQHIPEHYTCGCKFEWETNTIQTDHHNEHNYKTREQALMGLCLDNKSKFKKLVRKVYETNN